MVLDWLLRALLGDGGGDAFDWSGFFFFLLSIVVFCLSLWVLSKSRRAELGAERWAMRSKEYARVAARNARGDDGVGEDER